MKKENLIENKTENALAADFTFAGLIRFALPSMVMMICMSLYIIVDGIFISRFVGTDALSATNIVYPVITVANAIGILFSTGGSAIIARKLGAGLISEARQSLSLIVLGAVIICALFSALAIAFLDPLIYFLGASDAIYSFCRDYLLILIIFAPVSVLQLLFQQFLVTAGRPDLGMTLTILAGLSNILFDYICIVPLDMGIRGAAWGTVTGYLIPAVFGALFFFRKKGELHFSRPSMDMGILLRACGNGSSEMVSNLSNSVITFLFNIVMMRLAGSAGVASITIVLYAQFLFTSLQLGYSIGISPVVSYNHGSHNLIQLKRTFRTCLMFVSGLSLGIFAVAIVFSPYVVTVFTPVGTEVYNIAVHGMLLFSGTYLFSGVNIFASAMFTALSNGVISAVISFMRTFALILPSILLLPRFLGTDGIWLAVPMAELICLAVSAFFFLSQNKRYHYLPDRRV